MAAIRRERRVAASPLADVDRDGAQQEAAVLTQGKLQHEPVTGARGRRQRFLDFEHRRGLEHSLIALADSRRRRRGQPLRFGLAQERLPAGSEDVLEGLVVVDQAAVLVFEELQRRALIEQKLGGRPGPLGRDRAHYAILGRHLFLKCRHPTSPN